VNLKRKLSTKQFIWSQIIILLLGLLFLGLLAYYTNPKSSESNKYSLTGPVTRAPSVLTLELNTPDDNSVIFSSSLLVSGKTQENIQVLISSSDLDLVTESKPDGNFSVTFPLAEGLNEIKIIAINKKGEQKEIDRIIYYSKEKI
jgi:hypothetical protein